MGERKEQAEQAADLGVEGDGLVCEVVLVAQLRLERGVVGAGARGPKALLGEEVAVQSVGGHGSAVRRLHPAAAALLGRRQSVLDEGGARERDLGRVVAPALGAVHLVVHLLLRLLHQLRLFQLLPQTSRAWNVARGVPLRPAVRGAQHAAVGRRVTAPAPAHPAAARVTHEFHSLELSCSECAMTRDAVSTLPRARPLDRVNCLPLSTHRS